ncbi:MAG: acylphosphatase [Candidatus Nanoarchaeia archaeon]
MKKAVKITIKGNVQGVFFRTFIKETASDLGVGGFVRNLDTGDVEIYAEGDGNNIEMLIEKCKQGPPHAQVRDVQVEERKWSGEYKDFKVLRF